MSKAIILRKYAEQELSRRSFWKFCIYYDSEFFAGRLFLKEIADALQDIEEGKIKSLSVSMPPRAGKSYVTSLYCAWTLGRNPRESVMRNTCTNTLYLKFSYDVRAIVRSIKFKEVFKVRLAGDKSNLGGWNTDSAKMVSYFGAGVGGSVIGFGASKVAITDDLYRGLEDALSDTVNDRILQWKEATHDSRFESGCARVDIGTRWSIRDLIGTQVEAGIYDKSIIVAALTPDNKSFCEAVLTTEEYLDKKKKTSSEIWLAEYMQEPVDMQGRLFSDLSFISPANYHSLTNNNGDHASEGHIAYIDVADQGKDYTAMAVGSIIGDKVYIVDVLYSNRNTDMTMPQAAALLKKYDVKYCRVESNAMGAMFARQLQKMTSARILQVHNSTNKMTRIIMHSVLRFSKEGKNKNDDAPDCLAGLAMFIPSMFRNNF